uniref:C2H2-type domain-containing protein n=1 Tax=Fundulus heteroclitus TaxID=8078 RepID=A0A3Q2QQY3_FUNHE
LLIILCGKTDGKHVAQNVASQNFSAPRNVKLHGFRNSSAKRFGCVQCGKSFRCFSQLEIHQRSHTGEKPFRCTLCGKRYAQKGHLYTHQRTHTGEKPYRCTTCGKGFIQKCTLDMHQRTHTGEKPFVCVSCGKAEPSEKTANGGCHGKPGSRGQLIEDAAMSSLVHNANPPPASVEPPTYPSCLQTNATKELALPPKPVKATKRFDCLFCGKIFNYLSSLKVHIRRHSGEKPFSCSLSRLWQKFFPEELPEHPPSDAHG